MMKLTLLLALATVMTAAMAQEPAVVKDTRSGTSLDGAPATGVLLTRAGQTCSLTEYKQSTTNPNETALPVVEHREFACDVHGNPVDQDVDAASSSATHSGPPDYYLSVDVMGARRRVPVHAGEPIYLSDAIHFAYTGPCETGADLRSIREAIFAGGDAATATSAAQSKAAERPAHAPASGESVELKSDAWNYRLTIIPSAISADGSARLLISGADSGPDNYSQSAANQCNGLKPEIVSETIPLTSLEVHGGGIFPTALLGSIHLQVLPQ